MKRWGLALALAVALGGCGGGGDQAAGGGAEAIEEPPQPPYEAVPMEAVGHIAGTVTAPDTLPPDLTIAVGDSLRRECRTPVLRITRARAAGGGLAGAVVWLADARRGKELPAARRFELTTEDCLLSPRVQPAIAGGMLNVLSRNRLEHRLAFERGGRRGSVDRLEQFDAGQVVPMERVLRAPGLVAVHSERFDWMRAWIHVFDHPYFALTRDRGGFALDSIPPGTYRLVAWHPELGRHDTTVTITARDTVRLTLALPGVGES